MKKIIVLIALVVMAASLAAARVGNLNNIKITKHDGSTVSGSFLYRDDQVFWLTTKEGKTLVLEHEIKTVQNERGDDITAAFLTLPPQPASSVKLLNAHSISIPLWLMAIMTAISFVVSLK